MSFKELLVKNAPAKHFTGYYSWSTVHQAQYLFNLAPIAQGDGLANRDGDQISIEAFKIHCTVNTNATPNYYAYRIIVLKSREEYTTSATTLLASLITDSGTPMGDILLPAPRSTLITELITNPKLCTKMLDVIVDVNSPSAVVTGKTFTLNIPVHKTHKYDNNSLYSNFGNYYMLCVPYVYGGANNVTGTGIVGFQFDTIFKNI